MLVAFRSKRPVHFAEGGPALFLHGVDMIRPAAIEMWLELSGLKLFSWEPAGTAFKCETKCEQVWLVRQDRGDIEATRLK